jgi:hypothetical protein
VTSSAQVSHIPTQNVTLDAYQDAWASFWAIPTIEELRAREALLVGASEDEVLDDCFRLIVADELRACRNVLNRRITSIRWDREREAMDRLRDRLKEMMEAPEVLMLAGVPMRRTGRDRHGREEWHGPCPVCQDGVDRLAAWSNPNSMCWCRRCGWKSDILGIAQSLMPSCTSYHQTVYHLAGIAALSTGAV